MKILALRGANLASLQHEFEIDFARDALAETGLFAITGKTGSGKSTLLDAICLALFDQMPRLQAHKKNDAEIGLGDESTKVKANDVRSILSRGKASGFAEVDFMAMDGSLWQARWEVRRARNKADGRIQPSDQSLVNLNSNQTFAGKKKEVLGKIEELVGLSYEQFRRAVMLPQGDFAAFLKASEDERAGLLERMTGREIYTKLSMAAYRKSKQQEAELNQLSAKLGDIEILPEEKIVELQQAQAKQETLFAEVLAEQEQLKAHTETLKRQQAQLESVQQAKAELEQALTAQQQAEPQKDELDWAERVQPARDDFKELNRIKAELDRLTQDETTQQQQLNQLAEQMLGARQTLAEKTQQLTSQQSHWQQTEPKLRQAASKDTEIAALATQLGGVNQQLAEQKSAVVKIEIELGKAQAQKNQLEQSLAKLDVELKAQQSIQPIAEHFQFVQDNLGQYASQSAAIAILTKESAKQEKALPELWQTLTEQKAQLEKHQQQKQQQTAELDKLNIKATEAKLVAIEQQRQQMELQIEGLGLVFDEANAWHKQLTLQQDLAFEQNELKAKLDLATKTYQQNAPKLVKLDASLKEAQRGLEQSQAIASLEEHRAKLEEGESCPLCGATEHPFVKNHPVVESVINQQKQRIDELQSELQQMRSAQSVLLAQEQQSKQSLTSITGKLAVAANALTQLKAGFSEKLKSANEEATTVLKLNAEQFALWQAEIKARTATVKKDNTQLGKEIKALSEIIKAAHSAKEVLHKIDTDIANAKAAILGTQSEQSQLEKNIEANTKQLADKQKELGRVQAGLAQYYSKQEWAQVSKLKDIGAYIDELKQQVANFAALNDNIKATKQALNESLPTIAEFNQAQKSATMEQDKLTKQSDILAGRLFELQKERNQIFDQPNLAEAENRIKQALASAEQQKLAASDALNELSKKEAAQIERVQSIKQELATKQKAQQQCWQQWQVWQQHFAIGEARLTELLAVSDEWRKAQHEALKRLNDAVANKQTLIQERQSHLDKMQTEVQAASDWLSKKEANTAEGLSILSQSLDADKKQIQDAIYQYRHQIDAAAKAKQDSGELLKQIAQKEQDARVWQQLNQLIGSADGKAFRNLAQSLTLHQLVQVANQHLHELKPRYALQTVPSSILALQVIDHDMGDEVRSVESLSGGESFLVSLSLALALASLAADNKKLGSLFIDEGFGTLDPESLDMALDCLDRLQQDGRQIGVISHVATLVERISTQVMVESQGSGASRVRICA